MSRPRRPAEDLLERVARQTKRSIRSAGPRYTPNVAKGAPNLVIEPVSHALAVLSGAPQWRSEREELTQKFAAAFRGLAYLSTAANQNDTAELERFIGVLRRSTTERPRAAARTIASLRAGLQSVRDLLERLDQANVQVHDVSRDSPEPERQRAERNSSILRDARSAFRAVENLLDAPATAALSADTCC
jgi:hypothetical protein